MNLSLALDVVQPLVAEPKRSLTAEDLARLQETKGVFTPTVKKLRDRHHSLARALVDCESQTEAAIRAGYSVSRVSILLQDPSFKELVEFYRANKQLAYKEFHAQLSHLAGTAAEELLERLEDDPEKFDQKELLEIVKVTADRTGYGPQSKNLNVNVNVDLAERLARAREQAKMIDGGSA